MHFLHNQWSDVSHIWQLWSLDDCLPSLCVKWSVAILFGCHGDIKFLKKEILNDNSSKTTDAVRIIPNSEKFGCPPLGLVAMATESSHTYNGKMVKLHFLYNQKSDVSHIWQLWSSDDCPPSLYVLWQVTSLLGCVSNIQFWKRTSSNDNFKTTEAVRL